MSSSSAVHHRALAPASRTENEMCDTLLKLALKFPLDSHVGADRVYRREDVVRLSHHLPDDLGGRGNASNCADPFAGRVGHRLPITACFGRGRQR